MPKIVNTALKAKAWTFEAKATGPEAKAIKFFEAPRGQGLASRTTSLISAFLNDQVRDCV